MSTFVAAALQMRTTRSVERNIADLLAMAGEAVSRGRIPTLKHTRSITVTRQGFPADQAAE